MFFNWVLHFVFNCVCEEKYQVKPKKSNFRPMMEIIFGAKMSTLTALVCSCVAQGLALNNSDLSSYPHFPHCYINQVWITSFLRGKKG